MAIFNSYVKLSEGRYHWKFTILNYVCLKHPVFFCSPQPLSLSACLEQRSRRPWLWRRCRCWSYFWAALWLGCWPHMGVYLNMGYTPKWPYLNIFEWEKGWIILRCHGMHSYSPPLLGMPYVQSILIGWMTSVYCLGTTRLRPMRAMPTTWLPPQHLPWWWLGTLSVAVVTGWWRAGVWLMGCCLVQQCNSCTQALARLADWHYHYPVQLQER